MRKPQSDAGLRRERKLRNWIRRAGDCAPEFPPVLYSPACSEPYLERLHSALVQPELLRELPMGARDRFVWNAGYDLEWVISQSHDASPELLRVLAAVPAAFHAAFRGEPDESAGLYMFWDNVTCFAFDRPLVQQAIFEALVEQLGSDDRSCQRSALHGFNHLEDPRCRPVIEAFQATCRDPDTVAYAEVSKNFATP